MMSIVLGVCSVVGSEVSGVFLRVIIPDEAHNGMVV